MVKISLDIEENVAGLLCYLLGWLTGIIFLILGKDSKFVSFHAMQSILTFLPLHILVWILPPFFGWLLILLSFILWIILMIKAYQGERLKLPVVGDIAEKYS
jgi:uncharacterized membrane protein